MNRLQVQNHLHCMGFVYFVQTALCRGTNIYKIGATGNIKQRLAQYGKNSEVIGITQCTEYKDLERSMIDAFKIEFHLKHGREWFTGNKIEMKNVFDNTCSEWSK